MRGCFIGPRLWCRMNTTIHSHQPQYSDAPHAALATAAPISSTIGSSNHPKAEFLRLPKPGTLDSKYNLCRSTWNSLILPCAANDYHPPIKSISLRKRGAVRGVRLIVADSARTYFNSLIAQEDSDSNQNNFLVPRVRTSRKKTAHLNEEVSGQTKTGTES